MFKQLLLLLFLFLFSPTLLSGLPDPDPATIQPLKLPPPSPSTTTTTVVPAFPEQSNIAGCPLNLPNDLFPAVKSACTGPKHLHKTQCCPVLAAWLYSAYSATALGGVMKSPTTVDMPLLPDDSETCVDGLGNAFKRKGIELVKPNETCDVVYCYCGIRLHPLTCPETFRVSENGQVVGDDKRVKRLEKSCLVHGLGGCSKCLHSLYQLNKKTSNTSKPHEDRTTKMHNKDCQLMGLTWLLAKNRTAYIHTVSKVLRAMMMSTDGSDPRSCTLNSDGMPLAVDSSEINDQSSSMITRQNLDSAEEVKPAGDHKEDGVENMDEDVKEEVHVDPEPVKTEPKGKEKEVASTKHTDMEVEQNKKRHLNVVFIGHVDAGKSTIGGQILFLSGQVDDRTIQKYEKEAKDKSRESWYMAYIMDTNEEERVKGITVEVGRAHFETDTTRFTILDAPGHKSYVPNMISGASQADIGVLVISARKGEFETGFERGGQTREHVQLAKTLGVTKLFVVVNKMDDPTVNWSKERYDEIEGKMIPFLKTSGYNVKKDVQFLPISGLMGTNLKTRLEKSVCPWWSGPCLFEALDSVEVPLRDPEGPFRLPILDKFKDMGAVVMGKVESGSLREGDTLMVMPNRTHVKVVAIYCDEDKVRRAGPGENLRVRVSGIEEEDILPGFVLSSVANPIHGVTEFVAQLQILELVENAIFTAGYKAVLHIHSVVEECEIVELIHQIDPKTRKPLKKKVLFVKMGAMVVCRIQVNNLICVEKFSDFPQLGRFTLRTEGKTVAVGKVTALPSV
ncbi:hypothetical protein ACFE04_009500 [Oxalis oulophora]